MKKESPTMGGGGEVVAKQLESYTREVLKMRGEKDNYVYLVIVCSKDEDESYAIFSSLEKAKKWADKQEDSCFISPWLVDDPDFGSVEGELKK